MRRAEAADHETVVRVLVRAFDADPIASYMLRGGAAKSKSFARAFGTFFRHLVLPHREAWIDGDDGVALWTPPGKWNATSLPHVIAMGPSLLAAVGVRNAYTRAKAAQRSQDKHPSAPHWYLFAIGVDPRAQGRGVGTTLLRVVLDRCDAEKSAAYLEASTEASARLYERHGFQVTEELRIADDAPPMWLMWREPR
jgi:ribosomal protein S18 acetylase RimI-like enzyme